MNIEEFILCVEKKPLMYVEKVRIDYIYYLIKGYLGGCLDKKQNIDVAFHSKFYQWVLKWINDNTQKNFDKRASFHWHNILTEISTDEKEAVELFFKLSKQFFEEYRKNEHV